MVCVVVVFFTAKIQEHGEKCDELLRTFGGFQQHGNVESFVDVVYSMIYVVYSMIYESCLVFLFEIDILFFVGIYRNVLFLSHIPKKTLKKHFCSTATCSTERHPWWSSQRRQWHLARCRKSS